MLRLHDVSKRVARVFRRVHAGDKKLAWHRLVPDMAPTLVLTSPDFDRGRRLPRYATVTPPVLEVTNVPARAVELVVVCEGPDAPLPEPFVHWLLYRLEGRDMIITRDVVHAATQGKNSKLEVGWAPLDPPAGHGTHHYHFQAFALDQRLAGAIEDTPMSLPSYQQPEGVMAGTGRTELLEQMRGHVIAWGEIVGTFNRR